MLRIPTMSAFRALYSLNNSTGILKANGSKSYILLSNSNLYKNFCEIKVDKVNKVERIIPRQSEHKLSPEIGLTDKNYTFSDDPNVFGGQYSLSDELEDEGDLKEEEYIKEIPTANKELIKYAREIKKLLKRNKIKEALDILEIEMKKDRVQPDKYIFNILISGCAKIGYTRKAFKLFFKMKQYGLLPSAGTYTSLFNACANAPLKLDGVQKANRVREIMIESDYKPNEKNYNAMIKAYGRCDEIHTAFKIVDEMIEKNLKIETSTFNFLLQACASDKDFGFRHALLTWHKMKSKNIPPDIYTFNTMIRCIKNCSIGDVEMMNNVIDNILNNSAGSLNSGENLKHLDIPKVTKTHLEIIDSKEINVEQENSEQNNLPTSSEVMNLREDLPNLFCSNPHLGNLIEINEIRKPEDRLLLLGGFTGFLDEMKHNKVSPRLETFTALLEIIPATIAAEKKLISTIRKLGLKTDIDFFNTLIKKRVMRMDYDAAKEVLSMIRTVKLEPDIFTYGILSLTCKCKDEARELLNVMKEKDIRINIQILGAMLNQGCYNKDFHYITAIMQMALDEKIPPNEDFLKHLSKFNQQCARLIDINHRMAKSAEFKNNYKTFKENLHIWYEEHGISGLQLDEQIEKIKANPYKKFKEKTNNDTNDHIRKNKIRKHIQKIKLNDLKEDNKLENSNKL